MKISPTDHVVIYSKVPCSYCLAAKNFFNGKDVPFTEIDLTGKHDEMAKLKQKTGHMTFPQIFINDQFIGGFDDLMKKVE
ncbi:MAG: glutaredoxin 3 [Deltaproteobacteria bacterium]|nr:glutaredoxin 3 [Deltaproteobacteria bacterium]